MQPPDQADQLHRLLAVLDPVMSLQTREERFEKYQETWAKLNPSVKDEVWLPMHSVNFPWSGRKVEFWKTLRRNIEAKFQTALNEHLNGEFTDSPIVEFSFMHYTDMLLEQLDFFLKVLNDDIAIQDHITKVSANMDAYDEDERYMSEKSMRHSRIRRAQDFLDVILFMHAVPQREPARWDALDHASDVTWFRAHAEVYQSNAPLMAFLCDCAVVVLITGCFDISPNVKTIHDCYVQLK